MKNYINIFSSFCLIGCFLLITGCTGKEHTEHMEAAQIRWKVVRAQIKAQLAEQQYKAGHIEDSIGTLEETIALDPDHIDAHVLLAQAFLELGRPRSAEHVIQAALARMEEKRLEQEDELNIEYPDSDEESQVQEHPTLVYMQGVLAERRKDFETAIEHYSHAAELAPSDPDMLRAQVECMVTAGQTRKGFELLKDEITRYDADPSTYVLLADLALLLDEQDVAADAFQVALRTEASEDIRIRMDYGMCLQKLGRSHEAIATLEPIHKSLGTEVPASLIQTLAYAYLATDRSESARRLLTDYLRVHTEHERNWLILGQLSLANREWAMAGRCAREVRRLNPDSPDADLIEAVASWKLNDRKNAIWRLETTIARHPNDSLAHGLMGLILHESNPAQALRYLDRAHALQPDCQWVRDSRETLGATLASTHPERKPQTIPVDDVQQKSLLDRLKGLLKTKPSSEHDSPETEKQVTALE